MFLLLLLATFGISDQRLAESLIGDWELSTCNLSPTGEKLNIREGIYTFNIKEGDEEGNLFGTFAIKDTNEIYNVKFVKSDESYIVSVASEKAEEYNEFTKFTPEFDVEHMTRFSGKVGNDITFTFVHLSLGTMEITVYDTIKNEVTLYQGIKPIPKTENPYGFMQTILPILPVLYILFSQSKDRQAKKAPAKSDNVNKKQE
ncbi:hypothetical protein TRFO_17819 [Tritrichomonas foetus]|uniref:Lipocalin-like domain-containing protein n=1 Tax=Tritrichomonas foetus TaxID=1144522 RepID=A0A1J4KRB4_9EUKA|nr:hypothetical protein TRFO_17819 [Tritrichomonas foetus]|eukprot:OHT12348.1 hypothetical protein TRFO_17819 [Tritrichomonas foetus]